MLSDSIEIVLEIADVNEDPVLPEAIPTLYINENSVTGSVANGYKLQSSDVDCCGDWNRDSHNFDVTSSVLSRLFAIDDMDQLYYTGNSNNATENLNFGENRPHLFSHVYFSAKRNYSHYLFTLLYTRVTVTI